MGERKTSTENTYSHTYLVQSRFDDDEVYTSIQTAGEIIRRIDMTDCSNEELRVYKVDIFGMIEPLEIHGCWHDLKDPLYIKVVDANGNIIFDGHGTDH